MTLYYLDMATRVVTRAACLDLSFVLSLPSLCSFAQAAVSAAQHAVTFDSTFPFFPPLFVGSSGHFDNTIVAYRQLPKSFTLRTRCNYPLDLRWEMWLWDYQEYTCIFTFFTTQISLFNKYMNVFTVQRTNTYIYTYMQTPLAFNTLMWGSLRLAPISHSVIKISLRTGGSCEDLAHIYIIVCIYLVSDSFT